MLWLTKKEESVLGRQIEIGGRLNDLIDEFDVNQDTSFNCIIANYVARKIQKPT